MKKIIAFLMLITLTAKAGQAEPDISLEKFEKLCTLDKDPIVRTTNCKLAKMQRKAMALSKTQDIK